MGGHIQKIDRERNSSAGWDALSASVETPQISAAPSHARGNRQDSDRTSFDPLSCCMTGWDAFTHSRKLPDATSSQKPSNAGGDPANQAK